MPGDNVGAIRPGAVVEPIRPTPRVIVKPAMPVPSMAIVRLVVSGIVVFDGPATGRRYRWEGALSTQWVDSRDLPAVVALRKKQGCCGRPQIEKPMFAVARRA